MKGKPNFLVEFETYLSWYDHNDITITSKANSNHPGENMKALKKEADINEGYNAYKELIEDIENKIKRYSEDMWIKNKKITVEYSLNYGLTKEMINYIITEYRRKGWTVKKAIYTNDMYCLHCRRYLKIS